MIEIQFLRITITAFNFVFIPRNRHLLANVHPFIETGIGIEDIRGVVDMLFEE